MPPAERPDDQPPPPPASWQDSPARRNRQGLGEDLGSDVGQLLMPFGGAVGKRVMGAVLAEWQHNRSTALRAAEAASGLTREQFAEWAERDPRAVPLYMKVLWAAGMNGHDQTLRALGAVLGLAARASAAGGDDEFDQAELALRAMSDLTPRHFRVLEHLSKGQVVLRDDGSKTYGEFTPKHIAPLAGVPEEVVTQCLLNLAGAGLATSVPVYGGTAYPITDLGRAVIVAATVADG